MVYFAYLGKAHGLAKIAVVILGLIILCVGLHSYFNSAWVRHEVYKICDHLKANHTIPLNIESTCPSIALEKVFVVISLFLFTLSTLGLIGNLFSKQLSQDIFKLMDVGFNGIAGILVIVGGSLMLVSAISIDKLFNEIGVEIMECMSDTVMNTEYQLYEEKIAAGSISIIQGLTYFLVTLLLLYKA